MSPKVSICIPLYNAEKYIKETIESILNQTYRDFELVIVNNASADKSLAIIQSFNDPRIKIFQNNTLLKPQENWNRCIELAQGELIALYHSDDVYTPTIVEEEVREFEKNPKLGAVFTLGNNIDENSKITNSIPLPPQLPEKPSYDFDDIFIAYIQNLSIIMVCPTAMIPKRIYQSVGLYNNKDFKWAFDYDLYFRILENHPISIIKKPLIHYRIHQNQGTAEWQNIRTEENESFKIIKRYLSSPHLKTRPNKKVLHLFQCRKMEDASFCARNAILKGDSALALKLLDKAIGIERVLPLDPVLWCGLKLGLLKPMQFLVRKTKGQG